jgi:hypothetical protein
MPQITKATIVVCIGLGFGSILHAQTTTETIDPQSLLEQQNEMINNLGGFVAGSEGVIGIIAKSRADQDASVDEQVSKLDAKIDEALKVMETDKLKAKILAMTIVWVPIGRSEIDDPMVKHYGEIKEALLAEVNN